MKMRHRKHFKQASNRHNVIIRRLVKRIREVAEDFYKKSSLTYAIERSKERVQQVLTDLGPVIAAVTVAAHIHLTTTAQTDS